MKLTVSLLIVLLIAVFAVQLASPGTAFLQDNSCPEETYFSSETPFTLDEIQSIVGFTHPTLEDIATMSVYTLAPPSYFFRLTCTPYRDMKYVAILYLPPMTSNMRLLVFQVRDGQVFNLSTYDQDLIGWLPHTVSVSKFADRNFNGLPDFVIGGSDGAKGRNSGMRFLEMDEAGIITDITPDNGRSGPSGFDEINGDGIPELYDMDFYFVPTFSSISVMVQVLEIWWGWNGSAYETVRVKVQGFHEIPQNLRASNADSGSLIDSYLAGLTPDGICADMLEESLNAVHEPIRWKLFHILVYYHAWGNLDAGWAKIQSVLDTVGTCEDSDGKALFFSALDEFVAYFQRADTDPWR